MSKKRQDKHYKHRLGSKLSEQSSLYQYEAAFRRWLGRELAEGQISNLQAEERFGIPQAVVKVIRRQYMPEVVFLDNMTEAEKHQMEELQNKLKQLEKQLKEATIKNIALETLVDVAEQEFNIPIRKKPGAKQ